MMIFDTLYGVDHNFQPKPQMVEGHTIDDDGKTWKLTLRSGLKFHDGEPVLAKDVVASLKRWSSRDTFSQALVGVLDELLGTGRQDGAIPFEEAVSSASDLLGKIGSIAPASCPSDLQRPIRPRR